MDFAEKTNCDIKSQNVIGDTVKDKDGTAMTMTSTMKGRYLGPCPAGTAQ